MMLIINPVQHGPWAIMLYIGLLISSLFTAQVSDTLSFGNTHVQLINLSRVIGVLKSFSPSGISSLKLRR